MTLSSEVRRLWAHAVWADRQMLDALRAGGEPPAEALVEYAHVLGAEETWLARLEGRAPSAPVWPEPSLEDAAALAARVADGYGRLLEGLTERGLEERVTYRNSAGVEFTNTVGDILLHVPLHGQYHRGKVNLLLRQASREPAPVDYIAWVRGAAAATRADADRAGSGSGPE